MAQVKGVRAKQAMQFAGVDRMVFNEAVAAGHYPCAPLTIAGSARIFDGWDLVALFIFGRLLEEGMLPRRAGPYACEVRDAARSHEDQERIVVVRGTSGAFIVPPKGYSPVDLKAGYDPEHVANGIHYAGIGTVISAREFHIGNIRRLLEARIKQYQSIIGEDDAE